jgi:hypothetical protein
LEEENLMNVYEMDRETDDEEFHRYQELIVANSKVSNILEERKSRDGWFDNHQPIGDNWFAIKVVESEYSYSHIPGDYPYLAGFCSSLAPIFSQKAADALSDLLEGNGELLPLVCDFAQYYAFNVTREVEALDEERSEFKLDSELYDNPEDDPDFMLVTRFMFHPERVADLSIFHLPNRHRHCIPLVTDRFVQRVQEANLKGFAFKLLWSSSDLPSAV